MSGEFFICDICKGSGKVYVCVKDPEIFGSGIGKYICHCIKCSGMGRFDWVSRIKKRKIFGMENHYQTINYSDQKFIANKEIISIDPYRPLWTYATEDRILEWKDLHVQNVMVKEKS